MKKGTLVFNPNSGKGKAKERATNFASVWKNEFGNDLILRPTRSLADIRVAALETIQDPEMVPIFMGGDGTLSESVQGIAEHQNFQPIDRPVGLLPGGTGNSFLRDFGVTNYEEARDNLIGALRSKSVQNADLAIIKYQAYKPERPDQPGSSVRRITFNIFGVGIIADITEMAVKMRWMGAANYTVASLWKIFSHNLYNFEITIDGKREDMACNMISVHNSQYTGGAMHIAPSVRVNDGQLFYLVPRYVGKLTLLKKFPELFKGTHVNSDQMRTGFVKNIGIRHAHPMWMNVD
ncbi:MAG TPA: diacylglycerol kinase family protein, partial [Leptospiraceae bacterium]|nr:diacylglycerol kinase family protein [Leptospiraceae bacterium]